MATVAASSTDLGSSSTTLPPKPLITNTTLTRQRQQTGKYENNFGYIPSTANSEKSFNKTLSSLPDRPPPPIIPPILNVERGEPTRNGERENSVKQFSQSYDQTQLQLLNKKLSLSRQSIGTRNVLGQSNSFPNTASPSLLSSPMSTPGTQRRLQPSGIKLPAPPASLLNGLPKGVVMAAAGRRIGSGAQKSNLINGTTANVLPSAALSDHLREYVPLPEAAAQMLMRQRAEELLAANELNNFRNKKNGLASRGQLQSRIIQMPKECNNENKESNNNDEEREIKNCNNKLEKPLATIADEEMPQMKIVEPTLKGRIPSPLSLPQNDDDLNLKDTSEQNNISTSQQQIIPIASQTQIKTPPPPPPPPPRIQSPLPFNSRVPPLYPPVNDDGVINDGPRRRSISSAAVGPYLQTVMAPPMSPKGHVNMLPAIDEPTKKARNTITATPSSNTTSSGSNSTNNFFRNGNNKNFRKKWLLRGALIATLSIGILAIILVIILTSLPSNNGDTKILNTTTTTTISSNTIITTQTPLTTTTITTTLGPVNIVGGAIFAPISMQNHSK
uniref:Uncharacterized protein n=1 Tax=Meloidogyne enterolobii TaxID=390850 RepID=A0A6V7U445_MELEN|nr:unnamed protein product [Meloidogyne enterolobii]CAD2202317.1 unnamed protein product [Meloidogyne enterolobii]